MYKQALIKERGDSVGMLSEKERKRVGNCTRKRETSRRV